MNYEHGVAVKMHVFDFEDYQEFLKSDVKAKAGQRGYLTRLAEGAGCQKSYLSQVIKGHVNFTPEHAMRLALFWNLSEMESEYFIELVHLGRTSFQPLKNKIRARLNALQAQRKNLAKRLNESSFSEPEAQVYYASWIPSALHVAVDLEKVRTADALAHLLGLPLEVVKTHMEFLVRLGLVNKKGQEWWPTGRNIHLPNSSSFNMMNHQNWRSRALVDSQKGDAGGIHYTSIQTLSFKDYETIQELVLEGIDHQRKIVGPSEPQTMACLCVDWFQP
jgi:uncharacterized protein (TIGR02147 family)